MTFVLLSGTEAGRSESQMLRPADDLVLQVDRAIQEIIAVAGHPDDQVAVLLRMGLGLPKRVGRDDVELVKRGFPLRDVRASRSVLETTDAVLRGITESCV